jgi:hypothetical protein
VINRVYPPPPEEEKKRGGDEEEQFKNRMINRLHFIDSIPFRRYYKIKYC